MITVILDTNIYGKIVEDKDGQQLVERMKADALLSVHNFRLIRNELRGAPKLLPIYDSLVSKRLIQETRDIRDLAEEFFREYKSYGGTQRKKKILNDFKIIACAALVNCDIVYSEDRRTLRNPKAIKAYQIVCVRQNKRPPTILPYDALKGRYF